MQGAEGSGRKQRKGRVVSELAVAEDLGGEKGRLREERSARPPFLLSAPSATSPTKISRRARITKQAAAGHKLKVTGTGTKQAQRKPTASTVGAFTRKPTDACCERVCLKIGIQRKHLGQGTHLWDKLMCGRSLLRPVWASGWIRG